MNVYKYDEKTKEYTNTETALLDPLETEKQGKEIYLLPANATFDEVPKKTGYAAVWNGEQWELLEDNRGIKYWLAGDTYDTPAHEMKELGALPSGATTERPTKTLDEAKTAKLSQIDSLTAAKITGGFTSTCTGTAVTYDSDKDTQLTMQGIALNVNSDTFAEKYPDGCPVRGYVGDDTTKSVLYLTPAQVLAWQADLSIHIGTCKQWGWSKQAEVEAAATVEEVEAITLEV